MNGMRQGALRDYILNLEAGAQLPIQAVGDYFRVLDADGGRVQVSTDQGDAFEVQEGEGARVRPFQTLRVRNDGGVPLAVRLIVGSGEFESARTVGAVAPVPAGTIVAVGTLDGGGTIAANADRRELVMVADVANAAAVTLAGLPIQPGDTFTLEVTGAVTVTAGAGDLLHVAEVV